jgi:hypothetical protein
VWVVSEPIMFLLRALGAIFVLAMCCCPLAAAEHLTVARDGYPQRLAIVSLDYSGPTFKARFSEREASTQPNTTLQLPVEVPSPASSHDEVQSRSFVQHDAPLRKRHRNFWINRARAGVEFPLTSSASASLLAASTHADIWVTDELLSHERLDSSAIVAQVERAYAAVVPQFGTLRYSSPTANSVGFQYPLCDPGGKKHGTGPYIVPSRGDRFSVLIAPQAVLGPNRGYADDQSYQRQASLNCLAHHSNSNELPGLVVISFDDSLIPFLYHGGIAVEAAHELQHLVNYVRHDFGTEDTFANEGLSLLAQDFVATQPSSLGRDDHAASYYAHLYLMSPESYGITSFEGRSKPSETVSIGAAGSYGGAYLLQRYLYERFGETYIRNVGTSQFSGAREIEDATHTDFATLMSDFCRALAAPTASSPLREFFSSAPTRGAGSPIAGVPFRTIAPNVPFDIVPGSISFWSVSTTRSSLPSVVDDGGAHNIIVVPLGP